jgi:hypothetical protein
MPVSQDQAERLYSRAFQNLLQSDADVHTFRRIAELGKPAATASLSVENYQFALSIQLDPAFDVYFKDRKGAVEFFGGPEKMGASSTRAQLGQFTRAIDAASLIFIHSAVDAALSDLCQVALLLGPAEWEVCITNQKASIAELRKQGLEALVNSKLQTYVDALARESLLKRADVLFRICKPVADFAPVGGYSFDRAHLVAIDEQRHRVTHGLRNAAPIVECEQELQYLTKTGIFFAAMVNARFGVKINPLYALGLELPIPAPTAPGEHQNGAT